MKKVLSIALALLLLTTHMGFAITTHYCGGIAVLSEVVIGHQALDCGMAGMTSNTPMDNEATYNKQKCCDNEFNSLEVDKEFKSQISDQMVNTHFIAAYVLAVLAPIRTVGQETFTRYYIPPPPTEDLTVRHQVFLI